MIWILHVLIIPLVLTPLLIQPWKRLIRSVILLLPMRDAQLLEVMGRGAGHIALWCGLANGAEEILLPENYETFRK